jgi:dimethylamine corrinoid protein
VPDSQTVQQLLEAQRQAILDGSVQRSVALAHEAIASGAAPGDFIDFGYAVGIREVGRLWEEGEYFLPELVQGADAMKAAMAVLRPELLKDRADPSDGMKVVLGTVAGDIHDIGKTLVGTVLEANGFLVIDLGHGVEDGAFVESVAEESPQILGMSALLTTTMGGQRRVIELLRREGLRDRVAVMVGGAPVSRRYADEIGADAYAPNAMRALEAALTLVGQKT